MKEPARIVSARGVAGGNKPRKKTRAEVEAEKAANNERLIEYFENTKRQIKPQLRAAGVKDAAKQAEEMAAEDYGLSVDAVGQKIKRARRRKKKTD